MKQHLLAVFLFLLFVPAKLSAQKGEVRGSIFDSLNVPVSYASVAVFDLRDSSVITFGLSDNAGGFELNRLPIRTPLRLLVSHVLYHPVLENFELDSAGDIQDFDSLLLTYKSNEFAERVVTWEAPPISIRNDTVEFSADAFVGRPGSAVEELLKRIPGVQVDEDGNVTYNGRTVKKITIDSKQFFSEDPVILMKNIPAKAIEKVQVTEEKDERGRATESGDVTINLTLKPWAKKSNFGKVYGGYGTDQRYEAGGIWSFFRDTLQVSIIGYGNNLSQTGFSFGELYKMGGFNRSGVSSLSFSDNTMELDGVSFGGGKGITESGGGGFNLNYDLPLKYSISTSYFIGFSKTNYLEEGNSERYFGDTTLSTLQVSEELFKSSNHTFNAKIQWTPDTIHLIYWKPQILYNGSNAGNKDINRNSYTNFLSGTSIGNQLDNQFKGLKMNNYVSWDMRLKKWEYGASARQNYSKQSGDATNDIRFISFTDTGSSGMFQNQIRRERNNGLELYQRAFVEFKPNDSLRFSLGASYSWEEGQKNISVYERDSQFLTDVFLPTLSTLFNERRTNNEVSFTIWKRIKDHRFSAEFSVNQTNLDLSNGLTGNSINRDFVYWKTEIDYSTRSPQGYIYTSYSYSTEIPNSFDLLDLTDNTNPNRVRIGNPDLNPKTKHALRYWGRRADKNGKFGGSMSLRADMTMSDVVSETYYDESGRSVSKPRNLDAGKNRYYAGSYSRLFMNFKGEKKWSYSPSVFLSGNINQSWQYINLSPYQVNGYYLTTGASFNFVKKDYLDVKLSYGPGWNGNQTLGLSDWNRVLRQSVSADIWWAPFEKYWFEVKATYSSQSSKNPAFKPQEFTLVNLAFTRLVLKENRGQIRISVFDLLKQNRAINQYTESNFISNSQSNAVTRYLMFSFVYNFNSFQKTGRQQRGFSFW